jgi:uncharacterized protein YyaL (SSP411 family)
MACLALLILSEYTGDPSERSHLEQVLGALRANLLRYPTAFAFWLQALDFALGPVQEVALLWPANQAAPDDFLASVQSGYHPRTLLAASPFPPPPDSPELLKDRPLVKGSATAYVCQNFTCQMPTCDLTEFQKQLDPGG